MKLKEIQERIKFILENKFNIENKIKDDSNFIEDLGLDSLDFTHLILLIEDEFDISFSEIEVDDIYDFRILVCYVLKKVENNKIIL